MKKLTLILSILLFTSSAFAGSCPMMAKGVDAKIAEAKELRFFDSGESHYVSLEAPSLASNVSFVLPNNVGVDGQFLKTDGSGNLSFASPSENNIRRQALIAQALASGSSFNPNSIISSPCSRL